MKKPKKPEEPTKLTVRLAPALMKTVKAHAAASGITVQDFVVGSIERALPRQISIHVTRTPKTPPREIAIEIIPAKRGAK